VPTTHPTFIDRSVQKTNIWLKDLCEELESWVPARTPQTYYDLATFLDRLAAEASLAGETEASFAANAATCVLRAHVSTGDIEDVIAVLPPPVREVFAG